MSNQVYADPLPSLLIGPITVAIIFISAAVIIYEWQPMKNVNCKHCGIEERQKRVAHAV